jgi:hypothetical protein
MRIPGFTAEVTLVTGNDRYRSRNIVPMAWSARGVEAQFCYTDASGRRRCNIWYPGIGNVCTRFPLPAPLATRRTASVPLPRNEPITAVRPYLLPSQETNA